MLLHRFGGQERTTRKRGHRAANRPAEVGEARKKRREGAGTRGPLLEPLNVQSDEDARIPPGFTTHVRSSSPETPIHISPSYNVESRERISRGEERVRSPTPQTPIHVSPYAYNFQSPERMARGEEPIRTPSPQTPIHVSPSSYNVESRKRMARGVEPIRTPSPQTPIHVSPSSYNVEFRERMARGEEPTMPGGSVSLEEAYGTSDAANRCEEEDRALQMSQLQVEPPRADVTKIVTFAQTYTRRGAAKTLSIPPAEQHDDAQESQRGTLALGRRDLDTRRQITASEGVELEPVAAAAQAEEGNIPEESLSGTLPSVQPDLDTRSQRSASERVEEEPEVAAAQADEGNIPQHPPPVDSLLVS